MQVHIVNHMVHDIQVHRVGCADVAREKQRGRLNSDWILDVPAGKNVEDAVVDDLNDGFCWTPDSGEPAPWSTSNVRVMPCVSRP
jgi:hypothetical protein